MLGSPATVDSPSRAVTTGGLPRELRTALAGEPSIMETEHNGNYWSPGPEEQNAGLISKIGGAVLARQSNPRSYFWSGGVTMT